MTYRFEYPGRGARKRQGRILPGQTDFDKRKAYALEKTNFKSIQPQELSWYTEQMADDTKRESLFKWFDDEVIRIFSNLPQYEIDYTSASGKTLDKVQRHLVKQCIEKSRVLLDVEVGVGKTLISLVSAKNITGSNGGKCLVICEKKHVPYWKDEAILEGVECDAFNYEYFIRVAEGKEPDFNIQDYTVLIIDESHYRANLETKATKAMLKVLEGYTNHTFCLTATPVRNTLDDYLVQLKFIKHPLGLLDLTAFKVMFRITQRYAPDIERFRRLTKDVIHKATLNDAGIDIKVNLHRIDVDLTEECKTAYYALQQSNRIIEVQMGNRILPISTNKKKMEVLCAYSKINFTIQLIQQLNSKGKSAVVISNYNEKVLDIMGDKLGCGVFKAGNKNKDQLMQDFTSGKSSYLLAQRKIAQSGLNLQNSSCLILHDLHYSLDFIIQSIGRVKRRGQKQDAVDIYIPFCRDTDEHHIWEVLQEKWKNYLEIS